MSSAASSEILSKRRRGAQPGNKNAQGNRGNPRPRPNFGNRGGAPVGNANACKKSVTLHAALLEDYHDNAEAAAWINAHLQELASVHDHAARRDRALYDGLCGLTPERLAALGQEYRHHLYSIPREDLDCT
jgi:hypothetical protein